MTEKILVRVIAKKGKSALVEWGDDAGIHRAFVPTDSITLDSSNHDRTVVSADDLAIGLPYGVEWSTAVTFDLSVEEMEQALYRRGIWTVDDVRANPQAAVSALAYAYGANLRALYNAADSVKTAV